MVMASAQTQTELTTPKAAAAVLSRGGHAPLPSNWEMKPLKHISTPVRGGSPRPAGDPRYFNGSYIPWLTVAALTNLAESTLVVSETATYLTEEGSHHSRILEPGTLIIANSGATLGVAKILGIKCCANDGIAALLDLDVQVSPTYIVHYINSKTDYLRNIVARGNGQPNLNTTLIGNFVVAFPDNRYEQDAIAEALNHADALIESLEALIEKKRLIKQGAMQELLSGRKRLPGFSGEWASKCLGDGGVFFKGSGVRRNQAQSGNLPCVRYGELYTHHTDVIRRFNSWISEQVAATARKVLRGDILFAGSGETKEEIGKCAVLTAADQAYAGGDMIVFRPRDDDPLFLAYYLNSPRVQGQKAAKGQGDAVVHISSRALADLELLIPERQEQAAIAQVVTEMDAELEALEARLEKARQIKQGMMQELLTGRVRLV